MIVVAQLEVPVATVMTAARLARNAALRFVLDTAPMTAVSDELLGLATIVTVNGKEASKLSGIEVRDRESAIAAGRAIRTRGAQRVSVGSTDGRAVIDVSTESWLPNPRGRVVDTTGAGDACAAAIVVALAEGRSFEEACRFGHAAAALATTVLGARASLPSRDSVEALLRRS